MSENDALLELNLNQQANLDLEKLELESKRKYAIKLVEQERKSRIESKRSVSEDESNSRKVI